MLEFVCRWLRAVKALTLLIIWLLQIIGNLDVQREGWLRIACSAVGERPLRDGTQRTHLEELYGGGVQTWTPDMQGLQLMLPRHSHALQAPNQLCDSCLDCGVAAEEVLPHAAACSAHASASTVDHVLWS